MVRIICLLIGYAFGLFQTSYIYGRTKGIDIREHGSGNAGTTNALRTLGKKAGAITLAGDCIKCILAVLTVRLIFGASHPEMLKLLTVSRPQLPVLLRLPRRKRNRCDRGSDYLV